MITIDDNSLKLEGVKTNKETTVCIHLTRGIKLVKRKFHLASLSKSDFYFLPEHGHSESLFKPN